MKRATRIGVIVVVAIAGAASLGAGTIYSLSGSHLSRTHSVSVADGIVPAAGDAVLARGGHLVRSAASCMECHGTDLGGAVMSDDPMGRLTAPNLTRGAGGVGATFSDADWVRAIRHGVRADGTSLIVMPSDAYSNISDADLGAMIAFLKELPPVDRELPATKLRLLGRALLAAGKLPVLVAEHMPEVSRVAVEEGESAEYGRYLAGVSGCISCHNADLAGGKLGGPPGTPPSSNLTTAALGAWSEDDFFRAMREGRKPDGTEIDSYMPWRYAGQMTDAELRAIWLFMRSLPPVDTRQ